MKIKNIVLILLSLIILSCEDYLDRRDLNAGLVPEEDIWKDKNKIQSMAYRLYDCTTWWFEIQAPNSRHDATIDKNYVDIACASGEVLYLRSVQTNTNLIGGNWITLVNASNSTTNPDFIMCWEDSWEAIYVSNQILSNIDGPIDPRLTADEKAQIKGEAFLFRALAYHEISRRWGPMPYFKKRLAPDMDLNLPRPTFLQQINDIVADCDSAIYYIPQITYLNDPIYMGRMGKVAAMALKSKALTTAASPNYVDGNGSDPALWERAAKAAWDVIALSMQNPDKVGLYKGDYNQIFHTLPGTIEGLWPRYFAPALPGIVYRLSYLFKSINGYSGYSPTQEMVDRFETADGWPVKDPRSGYNPQNPYVKRDPRFYKDILYHGSKWSKTMADETLDMRTTPLGADREPVDGKTFGNSATGYFARKIIPDKWNTKQASYNVPKYCNRDYIRMAEMYLNYAEAVNERYKDPKAKVPGADLSAVDALNIIRDRVGHVPVRAEFTSDANLFRERVREEFYVELCFEHHLWFDQLRWRTAEKYDKYNFKGVKIIDDATQPIKVRFEEFEISITRNFDKTKQYRYPLRKTDLEIYSNLKQNPGW